MNRERALQVVLGLMAVQFFALGAWAQLAPHSFYDDFPGGGRHWISADGPFNEHLVRDFGGLNLALGLVSVVALFTLGPAIVRAAAGAALVFAVPHFVYHLANLDRYDTSDQVANVIALSGAILLPLVVLAFTLRRSTVA